MCSWANALLLLVLAVNFYAANLWVCQREPDRCFAMKFSRNVNMAAPPLRQCFSVNFGVWVFDPEIIFQASTIILLMSLNVQLGLSNRNFQLHCENIFILQEMFTLSFMILKLILYDLDLSHPSMSFWIRVTSCCLGNSMPLSFQFKVLVFIEE